ncbi:hypothetical protein [Kribbella flavida]|nr:hypothetical protein [Kribbella flavida]
MFELVRHRDLSGVSGTGVVAEGCVFTDGSVALRWRGNNPATAVWPDIDSVLAVHGHQGATEVHWLEADSSTPDEPGDGRPETEQETRSALDELDHLFGVQHAVRPPGAIADPGFPGAHTRGWAGARHLR